MTLLGGSVVSISTPVSGVCILAVMLISARGRSGEIRLDPQEASADSSPPPPVRLFLPQRRRQAGNTRAGQLFGRVGPGATCM